MRGGSPTHGGRALLPAMPRTKGEATLLGARFYYTGKDCVNGHVAMRYAVNGYCWQCQLERNQSRPTKRPRRR